MAAEKSPQSLEMTCTAASLQLLLSPKDRNESALGGPEPCFLWQSLHFPSGYYTEAKWPLRSCLKRILAPDRCKHGDRTFLGNGEGNKAACVGGKQGQVAICFMRVELDHATFFPGIFFSLKIEQTQERLGIYVDEKGILSCSRASM